MIWTIAFVALALAAAGYALRKRKPNRNLVPVRVARKLVKANPSTLSVAVVDSGLEVGHAPMGTSSFLRSRGKPYRDGKYLWLTVPNNFKSADPSAVKGQAQLAALSFLHSGAPHTVVCRLGRGKRIDHSVAAQLDESIEVACRVYPVGRIKKEERRQFLRHLTAATDSGSAATPYISFDTFVRKTNKPVVATDGTELVDLKISNLKKRRHDEACAATLINKLRAYMLVVKPDERRVDISRICDSYTFVSKIKTLHLHHADQSWTVALFDLEDDSHATSFNVEQPSVPLNSDDRVVVHFHRRGKHFEMTGEVTQANPHSVTVRPTGPLSQVSGLELAMVDFSSGGTMVQGGRKLVEFLLGKPVKGKELSSDNPAHVKILRRLRRRFVHFTFYPRLHFQQVEKRFHPRLPHKICLLGQIMRSEFVKSKGRKILRHGVQFISDEHRIAEWEGAGDISREAASRQIAWRRMKEGHGNRHFNEVHTKLGRLSGFLESRSRDGDARLGIETEIRDNRVTFVMRDNSAEGQVPRKRQSGS